MVHIKKKFFLMECKFSPSSCLYEPPNLFIKIKLLLSCCSEAPEIPPGLGSGPQELLDNQWILLCATKFVIILLH